MAGRLAAFEVTAAGDTAGNFGTSIPHLPLHTVGPHGAMCEADTMRSASLLAAEPGAAGHLEPLPVSVPRYAESSDPIDAVRRRSMQRYSCCQCVREDKEKEQLWPCLNCPPTIWEMHRDGSIPERTTGSPLGILQITQQSGESVMRRGRSRCCPVGTHPGHTA